VTVLVDTSVWIDHLRRANVRLGALLHGGQVVVHPFVVGELALGNVRRRAAVLGLLANMPRAPVATDAEVLTFIERRDLIGKGIGLVDAHLLASAVLAGVALWTFDKRLGDVATMLRIT
jgi:predicted nucleic acid-binding protein